MKTFKYILFIICLSFSSIACSIDDDVSPENQDEDLEMLQELFAEITMMANEPCTDATQWDFVAYGSKACGGPQGYIAYPTTINVEDFLALVENYTTQEAVYNETYGIISTCDIPAEPTDVICEDGVAVLVYE